jgi:hypothetical protein
MKHPTQTQSAKRTDRTQFTADAAREIFLAATEALFEESDVYDVMDLRDWRRKLIEITKQVALERGDELDSSATAPLDVDAEEQ